MKFQEAKGPESVSKILNRKLLYREYMQRHEKGPLSHQTELERLPIKAESLKRHCLSRGTK